MAAPSSSNPWQPDEARDRCWSSFAIWGLRYTYGRSQRKLEHGFRRIRARIPYTFPEDPEDNDVPTFWLLLYTLAYQNLHFRRVPINILGLS